jgi:RNA polymerase subunit RPABC4/transcription elongation factor Spt4
MDEALNFFINFDTSDWMGMSLRGVFVYLFILWVAMVVWVARDVVGRSKNLIFQVFAILLTIALNIFGLLIYLIIRPQKTLVEKYHEELEHRALSEVDEVCPDCGKTLPLQFRFCPHCGGEARKHCKKCNKLVSKEWSVCPYCGMKKSTQKKVEKENGKKK